MKKLFAVILVCLLCMTAANAAEWGEGLGPEQPYPGVRKIELDKEMGYCFTYPRPGLEASRICDTLEIYLPREDVELGEGHAHLYDSTGEIVDIDFANPEQAEVRPLEEAELEALRFGGGVCVEMHLPVSLKFGESYYVLMDLFCFSAAGGKIPNYDLTQDNQWTPVLNGDFGISGVCYCNAPAQPEASEEDEEAEEEAEPTAEPEEAAPAEPKYNPVVGDEIHFDLVLGGDAKSAVVFSENGSAYFDVFEFNESATVVGTVTKGDLDWGVVFLDENDEPVDVVKPRWAQMSEELVEEAEAGAAEAGEGETVEIIG